MSRLIPIALALLTTSLPALAQNPVDTQPGMWEYRLETKMPGMAVPPQTFQRCLTAQDVAQHKHLIGEKSDKNPCTISNFKAGGGKLSFDFMCKSAQTTMKGVTSGSATATSLDLETRMHMVPAPQGMGEMIQKMQAKRIGNC